MSGEAGAIIIAIGGHSPFFFQRFVVVGVKFYPTNQAEFRTQKGKKVYGSL